ncbi:hypothetical protein [Hespellia stercorisuis]|uniref:Uncharacterized protein n=1 Tax=Hespellia stercorisuis DSM 15480 TaxID=1121950 RepID=A0A1M6I4M4_9FIRM|nr:hypothetical protein [Hespellia stercorisuis]SHJ29372.1 hypothetical protein SAMN02745243_00224 [Hespellia stercorisuis DSM 15480]
MHDIEQLFTFACSGDISGLEEYYKNGGTKNIRYQKFGTEHSLMMGAFRNCQFATMDYLKSQGETLTEAEAAALQRALGQMERAKHLADPKEKERESSR